MSSSTQCVIDSEMDSESQHKDDGKMGRVFKSRIFIVGVASVIIAILLVVLVVMSTNQKPSVQPTSFQLKPKNVIFMISDGFGPSASTLARGYEEVLDKEKDEMYKNPLDDILRATVRTRSKDSRVTDSSAGATAYSCAMKTTNNYVGVDSSYKPCGTIIEAARNAGMRTGVVVTSRLTHATPGGFTAHTKSRYMEDLIAQHEVDQEIDILMGGGLRFFIPQSESKSKRKDDWDGVKIMRDRGTKILKTKDDLDTLTDDPKELPVFGAFSYSHISYEIDRDELAQPSLLDMTKKALGLLKSATADEEKGFFILIEGSRIDHAAHDNDAPTLAIESVAYLKTVAFVREFIKNNPDTQLFSFSVLRQDPILSCEDVEEKVYEMYAKTYFNITAHDIQTICNAINNTYADVPDALYASTQVRTAVTALLSRKARVGFASTGHTGVDVNLYAEGIGKDLFHGNMDNTEVGAAIAKLLDLDHVKTTLEVQAKNFTIDNGMVIL